MITWPFLNPFFRKIVSTFVWHPISTTITIILLRELHEWGNRKIVLLCINWASRQVEKSLIWWRWYSSWTKKTFFHTNNEVFIINIFDVAFLFRFIHLLVDRLLRSCYFSVISRVTCLGEWCISLFHGVESRNFLFRAFLDEAWLCCNWLCDWVSWELSVPQLLYQVTSYFYCKKHEIW